MSKNESKNVPEPKGIICRGHIKYNTKIILTELDMYVHGRSVKESLWR